MGIPAYYGYLIKNYKKIIVKIEKINKNIDNFYLDSNSIIYNCLENMEGDYDKNFVNNLIKNICFKIDEYIQNVQPKKLIHISFDGVAPFAKLKQQKERRFKSKIISEILNEMIDEKYPNVPRNDKENKFDRTSITPGTYFMQQLDEKVTEYFENRESFYNVKKNYCLKNK